MVGILHPGAMGAALGSALKARAGAVIWAAAGRSHATAKRAELADLVAVPDVAELARRAHLIISICPPHAARAVAEEVAAACAGRPDPPLYVDANAVAPATVHGIGALLGERHVVDGAVIGAPAWERGRTVLWLSGEAAPAVADLFAGSPFTARVLGPGLGQASAIKACYALQTKALPTLWAALAEAADAYGVRDPLAEQLARDGVDLTAHLDALHTRAGAKAWRWAGEMDEAAAALAAVGVPDGFSRAAAEVYRRMADGSPDRL
ncbi:3-hydroxyisobutyrate dehydrogenase-like beta-hydroxyacid dehydrogenase [Pseudonocardia cypriaca]|uniref:3-hydroxyisobutyrate dehydrogenase-like beta-hydroxyacid dehydrogenase n=1 Tax=Pseudonocardia cypriaca TaxID=882449 RepID=A0A543GH66_9PSEU|nr:3-hydroxyisobutyrate dehydrogenase-like beta-hydroxyacid dehydrogenase [Pseudonocardia cypriaca]